MTKNFVGVKRGYKKVFCCRLFVSNSYCLVENNLKIPIRAGWGLKKDYAWESPTGSAQVVFETPALHWLRWQGVELWNTAEFTYSSLRRGGQDPVAPLETTAKT